MYYVGYFYKICSSLYIYGTLLLHYGTDTIFYPYPYNINLIIETAAVVWR